MNTKTILTTAVAVVISIGLTACGGGSGGGSSNNTGTGNSGSSSYQGVTDSFVIENLKKSNSRDYNQGADGRLWATWADGTRPTPCMAHGDYCHDDINTPAPEGTLHRYRVSASSSEDELIPVYFQGFNGDSRITQALSDIESVVGFKMFKAPVRVDLDGVESYFLPVEMYYSGEYQKKMPTKGGLIFTLGMTDNYGHVSNTPLSTNPPSHTVDSDGYYKFDEFIWVNIDSNKNGFKASTEVVSHEVTHALGVFDHFESFGNGAPFGNGAKAVLKTLYNNDAGSDFDNLTIYK